MKQAQRPFAAWPMLAGGAAGAVLFLLIFGPSTLDPTYDSWIFNGYIGVDILQHYAGWAAFRAGGWAFPLTVTSHLSWPFGGAAALADCVPLVALPAKLLGRLLPGTFQYFGWFVLLCMVLAGVGGARLLGLFGLSAPASAMGACFFASAPVLLERAFQHTALAAQFLVIFSLCRYFHARRQNFEKPCWSFCALAALAAAIHVYFVPMVLALCFATAVESMVARRRAGALLWLGGAVASALAVAFALGLFTPADYLPGGYGNFGLNLNALWNPASYNWGSWDASYHNLIWSRWLPERPLVGDSLGSFSYLGLGVMAGLFLAALFGFIRLWQRRGAAAPAGRRAARFVKGHAGLLVACACLLLFAVSNVVTAGGTVLLRLPLPDAVIRLCDTFRASGRLIWPVYYLIMLLAVAGCAGLCSSLVRIARVFSRWLPAVLLGALFLLQMLDLSPVLLEKRAYFSQPVVPASYAPPDGWERLSQRGRVFYLLEMREDRPTALRAALSGMPSNFYLLARGTPGRLEADMAATRTALLAGQLPHEADIVYVTRDAELAARLAESLAGRCEVFGVDGYTAFLPLDAAG